MDLGLTGRTAVVTGASKGIGHATARRFLEEDARVLAVARGGVDLPGAESVALDLTDPGAAATLAGLAGDADVLVNNLGGTDPASLAAGGFLGIGDDAWARTYELNLFATVRVTRALLPGLLRRRGVVVNVSSIGARAAYPPVDYGTAKAALTNLTKALAEEFGPSGLRAVTVSPGPTRTRNWAPEGYAGDLARSRGETFDAFMAGVPEAMGLTLGRLSEPEETAALIAFLASAPAGNLTGIDVLADAGAIKTT